MNIRSLALGSAASVALLAGGALAADLPVRAPAPAPVYMAPIFTWSGFYVGVNAGYAGDKFQYPFSGEVGPVGAPIATFGGKGSVTSSGALFGAQIGYNWQFASNWVLGVEADYQWSNIEGRVGINAFIDGGVGGVDVGATAGSEVTSFGTVRARLGYSWDRALVYVTGGWAHGRVKNNGSAFIDVWPAGPFFAAGASKRTTGNGWTVGAGVEYAFTDNLSFKTEYLYVDLGDKTLLSINDPFVAANLKVDTRFHVVRAGLNYRFGWGSPVGGPVVARY